MSTVRDRASKVPSPTQATDRAADRVARRVLRVGAAPAKVDEDEVYRSFSLAMVLSGLRCTLSYVILPFVLPALGVLPGVGPWIGIPVGVVALVFDVRGLRRFWIFGHRWRWPMTVLYVLVMMMVSALVGVDVAHIVH
jgi:hypothetical protein